MASKSPPSVRFLNYSKGVGTALTALAAFSATILSIWLAVKPAKEKLAKESYKVTSQVIDQLSIDIQKNHEIIAQTEQQCLHRIKTLEEKMQTYLSGFSAGMASNSERTGSVRNEVDINHKLLELLIKPKNEKLVKPQKEYRPPKRSLPSQKQMQQRVMRMSGD